MKMRILFASLALSFSLTAVASHRYDHVVIVIEENTDYAQVIGDRLAAPFINELADGGVNFTEFYAITHPSQPNYIHLFSGDHQGIVDDLKPASYPWTTPNLGAALIAAGSTFAGYSEDLPSIGDRDTTGVDSVINGTTYKLYRRKHNPWANWQTAIGVPPGPNQLAPETNRRFLDFPADFSQLPAVSFVIPNEQNDMHDGTIRMGDDWIRANLGAYAAWARTHNSLLVVTFDEDDFSGPNKIPTVFYGSGLTPGTVNDTRWTLHNLLRTLEDMHGAAHSSRAAKVRPLTGIFPNDPPVLSQRFRQGLNGYTDCADTMVLFSTPTVNHSATALLTADLDTDSATAGNQRAQILVKFDNLFGTAAGKVPTNAIIISAKLSMWTGAGANDDSNDLASAHRMLIPWSATATWDSLVDGVSADDSDAVFADSFTQMPELENAPVILDVTSDIAAFLAGTPNYGWLLNCTGADGWAAYSSESATVSQRPTLQIAYTVPVTTGFPSWQLAKFGASAGAAGMLMEDDPDEDGSKNLVEYALNSNPVRPATGALATLTFEGNELAFSFIRNLDATDVSLTIEATTELGASPWMPIATWTQLAGWAQEPGTTVSENADAVTLRTAQGAQRFLRIKVAR